MNFQLFLAFYLPVPKWEFWKRAWTSLKAYTRYVIFLIWCLKEMLSLLFDKKPLDTFKGKFHNLYQHTACICWSGSFGIGYRYPSKYKNKWILWCCSWNFFGRKNYKLWKHRQGVWIIWGTHIKLRPNWRWKII